MASVTRSTSQTKAQSDKGLRRLRSPASQPRTPAIKSSNGVLSPRLDTKQLNAIRSCDSLTGGVLRSAHTTMPIQAVISRRVLPAWWGSRRTGSWLSLPCRPAKRPGRRSRHHWQTDSARPSEGVLRHPGTMRRLRGTQGLRADSHAPRNCAKQRSQTPRNYAEIARHPRVARRFSRTQELRGRLSGPNTRCLRLRMRLEHTRLWWSRSGPSCCTPASFSRGPEADSARTGRFRHLRRPSARCQRRKETRFEQETRRLGLELTAQGARSSQTSMQERLVPPPCPGTNASSSAPRHPPASSIGPPLA